MASDTPDAGRVTDLELADRLDRLADAATPGIRVYCPDGVYSGQIRAIDGGRMTHLTDTPELDDRPDDMEFIAALDPATVRRLTAALRTRPATAATVDEATLKEVAHLRTCSGWPGSDEECDCCQKERAEIARLRHLLATPAVPDDVRETANLYDHCPESTCAHRGCKLARYVLSLVARP